MRVGRQVGFTLIEMMVVLIIIGIIVSVMVISVKTDDIQEHMELELNRMYTLLNLAREEAILQGQVMALAIGEDRYRFEIRDQEKNKWTPIQDDRVFRERMTVPGTVFALVIDDQEKKTKKDFKLKLSSEPDDETPEDDEFQRVLIEPSGEINPFELILRKEDESLELKLVMDADGELKIVLPEEVS